MTNKIVLFLLLVNYSLFAQSPKRAEQIYQEAKLLFAKEDYAKATNILEEAEKLQGKWTPEVGYLLMVALNKAIAPENTDSLLFNKLLLRTQQYEKYEAEHKNPAIANVKELSLAMNKIAGLYAHGEGVAQDYTEAMAWLKKAIDKGNVDAMFNMGLMVENGMGTKPNDYDALYWYQQAAQEDHTEAMFKTALVYEAVKRNYETALHWYKKAAEKGHVEAMFNIGQIYACVGQMHVGNMGFPQDYSQAIFWYKKAAEYGDTEALQKIVALHENSNVDKKLLTTVNPFKFASRVELLTYNNRLFWWFKQMGTTQLFQQGKLQMPTDSILTRTAIDTANLADWEQALYTPQLCEKTIIGKCYEPRHLLVFYNEQNHIIGCIEICITCAGGYTSAGLQKVVFCPNRTAVLSRLIKGTLIN